MDMIFARRRKKSRVLPAQSQIPEIGSGILSRFSFQWISPLISIGYRKPLELSDMWPIHPARRVGLRIPMLKQNFDRLYTAKQKHPLFWALYMSFRPAFWLSGCYQLLSQIFIALSPLALRFLIQYITDSHTAAKQSDDILPIGKGVGLAMCLIVMQIIQSFGYNQSLYLSMLVGGEAQAALIGFIYGKSFKISCAANARRPENGDSSGSTWDDGTVFSLASVHAHRIVQASTAIHALWTTPIATTVAIVLLIVNLGYSAITGLTVVLIGLVTLSSTTKLVIRQRIHYDAIAGSRASFTQELISSMRLVKYFAWEDGFAAMLRRIREDEMRALTKLLRIRDILLTLASWFPVPAAMVAFITLALTGHHLEAAKVFPALALFTSLRVHLQVLPNALVECTDAWSSLNLIETYLTAEESLPSQQLDFGSSCAILVKSGSFTWDPDPSARRHLYQPRPENWYKRIQRQKDRLWSRPSRHPVHVPSAAYDLEGHSAPQAFSLQDINLEIGRHELVAIVGGIGDGKTSLMAALMGEMRRSAGVMLLQGTTVTSAQHPWIQYTSLRNNILFGNEMNPEWYQQVLNACALQEDLKNLPNGDATEIGERGVTISGGQKKRLSLARAVYAKADIIFMDDPLSAVDAQVGQHIFDHAICGLMARKCRVIATHQLQVLRRCDRIIWLQKGRIVANGTYDNIIGQNETFANNNLLGDNAIKSDKSNTGDSKAAGLPNKSAPLNEKLMQEEEIPINGVPWSLYVWYIRLAGPVSVVCVTIILLLLLVQGIYIVTHLWLSFWVSQRLRFTTGQYIGVYIGLTLIVALIFFSVTASISRFSCKANMRLLESTIRRVLYAPMAFFDTVPLGSIMGRLLRDIDVVDNELPMAIRMYLISASSAGSLFIFGLVIYPLFAIVVLPVSALIVFATHYYRRSSRTMKRHEVVLRSAMFSKLSEGLSGTSCIRAYGLENAFVQKLEEALDHMNSVSYLTIAAQRWISVRLDVMGVLLIAMACILSIVFRQKKEPSIVGLFLALVTSIVPMIQYSVRLWFDIENSMNALERLQHYSAKIEQEDILGNGKTVSHRWPSSGEILLSNVKMRYREGLPLVLKGLNLRIRSGEHIGIVGRTGAGKSSIIHAFFRMVELADGIISIDGQDISTINLHVLRSRMTIIPQDPVLFSGTIRLNLDPLSQHSDHELWSALHKSQLVSRSRIGHQVEGEPNLDTIVQQQGANLSLGQRQLLALARAMVRNSTILVLDEATSSVDTSTDRKIHDALVHSCFSQTIICIAHRLRTVLRFDRVCVLDEGRIVEIGTPLSLFEKNGMFHKMCEQNNIQKSDF